ncbi:nucleoside deaminase [Oenococcus sp. UCMA 16435]|nr:nucleoside deaminase [Oenococcus sp. UCMA 16435]MDI4583521.1 tRNA-specific adenosine deaminase [Oenococcus sp. UCMA 14587]
MSYDQATTEEFMQMALKQAQLAFDEGEVPIGAVLVKNGQVIAADHNRKEQSKMATAHAEKLVIETANHYLGSWRLNDCSLFVTIEPCVMCCGAIIQSRIPKLFYGATDPKFGGVSSLYHLLEDSRSNHFVEVHPNILADQSTDLMQSFFRKLRQKQ